MSYTPPNPNGQATMANSSPVVVASDQSNIPINNAQVAGSTIDTNSGTKSAGTQRMVLATDQPTMTNAQPVTLTSTTVTGTVAVTESGTWTVQPGNTANTTAWKVDGSAVTQPVQGGKTNNNAAPGATNVGVLPAIANAAAPTWIEGDQVLQSEDLSGNQRVTMGTVLSQAIDSILTYPFGHSYAHISTATTTTIKSGAGVLHNISVNTLGTVASTTTVYDNTAGSGTVIAVINTLALSGSFVLDVAFSVGLTVVTTGTVAPDITVSYR